MHHGRARSADDRAVPKDEGTDTEPLDEHCSSHPAIVGSTSTVESGRAVWGRQAQSDVVPRCGPVDLARFGRVQSTTDSASRVEDVGARRSECPRLEVVRDLARTGGLSGNVLNDHIQAHVAATSARLHRGRSAASPLPIRRQWPHPVATTRNVPGRPSSHKEGSRGPRRSARVPATPPRSRSASPPSLATHRVCRSDRTCPHLLRDGIAREIRSGSGTTPHQSSTDGQPRRIRPVLTATRPTTQLAADIIRSRPIAVHTPSCDAGRAAAQPGVPQPRSPVTPSLRRAVILARSPRPSAPRSFCWQHAWT